MRNYIVFDIETTGISPEYAQVTEIGALRVSKGEPVETYSQLINPGEVIPDNIVELTGITDEMVKDKPMIDEVLGDFINFCGDDPVLGHNVMFDFSFIKLNALQQGMSFEKKALDTLALSRHFLERQPSYSLTNLIALMGIDRQYAHRAYNDAYATYQLYELIYKQYYNQDTEHYFEPKPLEWRPKKQSPITEKQKRFLISLIGQHSVEIDYDIDALSKSYASKEIDRILRTYGR